MDIISDNKRYELLVKEFEKKTSALVYHVIEGRNTLALLYVGADPEKWDKERPGIKFFEQKSIEKMGW